MAGPTDLQVQEQAEAFQPLPDPKAAPHPMADAAAPPSPIQAAMTPPPAKTTPSFLDSVISTVDGYTSAFGERAHRLASQADAGIVKGAVNVADAVKSGVESIPDRPGDEDSQEQGIGPDVFHPAYDAARKAALDFRDSLAVSDPNLPENLAEGAGQLMPSFLMFSRVIGSFGKAAELANAAPEAISSFVGRTAKFAAADAATNATAIAPHDPRLADTVSLLQHSEGKFTDLLNTVAPDGSLVNHYINYLADRSDEGEAEGRWKNVLDGYNTAAALGGTLHIAGGVFKQGWNALHYMADNNMGSMSDLMPANQEGMIGYHGTDAKFDKFDNNKIGTGEGNQSFGVGHYIAENPQVAGAYGKNTLHVGVPDDVVGQMMDWDRPMSEQPEVARKLGINLDSTPRLPNALTRNMTGQEVYSRLSQGRTTLGATSPEEASKLLLSKGITGNKYMDAGSRSGGGSKSSNYVLFNPEHAIVMKPGEAPVNMSMSPEERALERERIAAIRDKEEGVSNEHTPEHIPANAAEREGAAMRRRKGD